MKSCYIICMTDVLTLSPQAGEKILAERQRQANPSLKLRLLVDSGGCAGYAYQWSLTDAQEADDIEVCQGEAALLIDPISLPFVAGGRIDYIEEMLGSYFTIDNPNAASGCGCGTSFSTKQ